MFEIKFLGITICLASCGVKHTSLNENGSILSQLTKVDHSCKVWDEARVTAVMERFPDRFVRGFEGDSLERVGQAMAGIPDLYLDWLIGVHSNNGFYIEERGIGFSGGVTEMFHSRPTYIHLSPGAHVVDFALQHEVGHAIQPYMRTVRDTNFDSLLGDVADNERNNKEMNAYPKSYRPKTEAYHAEFWGEAFNSYYCSEETYQMLQDQFPTTFEFLQQYAAAPVWGGGSTGPVNGINRDIFLALKTNGDLVTLSAAGSVKVEKISLCKGDRATCLNTIKEDVAFSNKTTVGRRNIFDSTAPYQVEANQPFTILGFDVSGNVVSAQAMQFEPANRGNY